MTSTLPPLAPIGRFIAESNRIEGIDRPPTDEEYDAHAEFLSQDGLGIDDLQAFVAKIAPGHRLRSKPGMDVRVGRYVPPPGGPGVTQELFLLMNVVPFGDPYKIHQGYEKIHPFTDGNGRSGRALWLWMMLRNPGSDAVLERGFLHTWYYQSLSAWRG